MTKKKVSSLSRKELLEMLLGLSTENEELREKLEAAEAALRDRQIKLDAAGSIAEAALQLNGVFEAAEAACRQYMDNIERLSRRQEESCAHTEEDRRFDAAETARSEDCRNGAAPKPEREADI